LAIDVKPFAVDRDRTATQTKRRYGFRNAYHRSLAATLADLTLVIAEPSKEVDVAT
jgi:hypothetical protein